MSKLVKPKDRMLTPHEIALMILSEMGYGEMTIGQAVEMIESNKQLADQIEVRFKEEIKEENERGVAYCLRYTAGYACGETPSDI